MKHGENFEDAIDEIREGLHHLKHELKELFHCQDGDDNSSEIIVIQLLRTIRKNQELGMAQIDDLNSKLQANTSALETLAADVKAIPAVAVPTDLTEQIAAVDAQAVQIAAIDADVKALTPPPTA